MSRIKGRNTGPELLLKRTLIKRGFTDQPKIYGKPDFIHYRRKTVIFVDGCFWHKCPEHFSLPASNKGFWKDKISRNIRRDKEVNLTYFLAGWRVVRIWEHEKRMLKNL